MSPSLLPAANPLAAFGPQLIWIALVVALLAIPQVRRPLVSGVDRVRDYFYGPPVPAAQASQVLPSVEGPDLAVRREIEDFDLSIFETQAPPPAGAP